jgi:hypothetical protein
MKPDLLLIQGSFTIHRLALDAGIPDDVFRSPFYHISKTENELSVVCPTTVMIEALKSESGWSCIAVAGPLDFALTGILAGIATVLARSGISIFAISTFERDYILIKSKQLETAITRLENAGYNFRA